MTLLRTQVLFYCSTDHCSLKFTFMLEPSIPFRYALCRMATIFNRPSWQIIVIVAAGY
jgi:hypothetical protein